MEVMEETLIIKSPDDIKRVLRLMRSNLGLKQRDIGDLLGVSQQQVSYWERGLLTPRLEDFLILCSTTGQKVILVPYSPSN